MAKRIVIREIEPLELQFRDKILECNMNNDALMLLSEVYGDVTELMEQEKDKPYDLASKLLYCGVRVNHLDFTYEEAKVIICSGGLSLITEIFENLTQNFMTSATDEQKDFYLGELQRLMKEQGLQK